MTRAAAVRCTLTPLSPSFAHARRKATVDRGHPQHTSCRRWLRRHCSCSEFSDSSCCSKRCDGAIPSSACGCRPSARTGQRPKMGQAAAEFSTRAKSCNCSNGKGRSCCREAARDDERGCAVHVTRGGSGRQLQGCGLRLWHISRAFQRTSCARCVSINEGGSPATLTNCTRGPPPRLKIMQSPPC